MKKKIALPHTRTTSPRDHHYSTRLTFTITSHYNDSHYHTHTYTHKITCLFFKLKSNLKHVCECVRLVFFHIFMTETHILYKFVKSIMKERKNKFIILKKEVTFTIKDSCCCCYCCSCACLMLSCQRNILLLY